MHRVRQRKRSTLAGATNIRPRVVLEVRCRLQGGPFRGRLQDPIGADAKTSEALKKMMDENRLDAAVYPLQKTARGTRHRTPPRRS